MPDKKESGSDVVAQARAALASLRAHVRDRTIALASIEAEIRERRMTHAGDHPDVVALEEKRAATRQGLAAAMSAEREALELERSTVAILRFDEIDSRSPIALLPYRVETRFDRNESSLLVRIYPDEIAISTHDPGMSEDEWNAGLEYWQTASESTAQEAWRKLLLRYPSPRAAWIVRQTTPPSGGIDDGDFRLFLPRSFWTAATSVLPDRWRVRTYRESQLIHDVNGNTIPSVLAVVLDPSIDANDANAVDDVSGHGLLLDRAIRWTVDFDAAEKIGMAVRLPLSAEDLNKGFDQLFVIGVKASMAPAESALQLESLFEAHHYSRGFSLLREGTPAHNTSETRAAYPAPDPGGAHSFPIEREGSLRVAGGSGDVFAKALGMRAEVLDHIENAGLLEFEHGRALRDALWPGTLGYYIHQMLEPWTGTAGATPRERYTFVERIDTSVREHFVNYVAGGAALPSFRVGRSIYGLLPVTSLLRWQPGAAVESIDKELPKILRTLLAIWSSNLAAVPRILRGKDADGDLLATAGMDARSRLVRVRSMLGPTVHFNLLTLLELESDGWGSQLETIGRGAMKKIGHGDWDPSIAWMSFMRNADAFANELVAPLLSESDALHPNYIEWIRNASIDVLRSESFPSQPKALLYHLLRWSALCQYDRVARRILVTMTSFDPAAALRCEAEILGSATTQSPWQRFVLALQSVSGSPSIGGYILDPARTDGAQFYRTILGAIKDLPTAELERLFTATLDLCSHRLDAWITSLAAKRLQRMRSELPRGIHIGGYGWMENVRPAKDEKLETLDDGRPAVLQKNPRGYIHAPAMNHAAAAALFRAAEEQGVDLSSTRVGKAMRLLEKIRSGESLGSALGHQCERGLRDHGAAIQQLRASIEWFRNAYPLVANKLVDSHLPANIIASRNVVDGLRLADAYRDGSITFDATLFPPESSERLAAEDVLHDLRDTIDAVSDLLTIEGLYQSLSGNTAATAATLDTISRGVRPPEIECVRQLRGGIPLTHRFAIILGSGQTGSPSWTAAPSPRAIAEPHLDAWYETLLGDPSTIRCRALVPNPSLPDVPVEVVVSFADLQLRPIDFIALAAEQGDGTQPTELEIRIARAAGAPGVGIDNTPWPDRTIRTLAEAMQVARAIRQLVAASRPLRAEDLASPANRRMAKDNPQAITQRGIDARAALKNAGDSLAALIQTTAGAPAIDAALAGVAQFGVRGALTTSPILFPDVRDELIARAKDVLREVTRRVAEAMHAQSDEEIMRAVFEPDFVLLREFAPKPPAEFAQALAQSPALVGGDALAVPRWIQKAAPVRTPLARYRTMALCARAFSGASASFDVVQLPFASPASWVALPFADEDHRPPSGSVSIVMQRVAAPAATNPWAGLFVDEWTEIIPAATEQTALSFDFDHLRAEAPQAVLIVVPPVEKSFEFDAIADSVRETLQLAKIRAADLEMLGEIGQLIPALCVASSANGATVSVDLTEMLATDEKVEVSEP